MLFAENIVRVYLADRTKACVILGVVMSKPFLRGGGLQLMDPDLGLSLFGMQLIAGTSSGIRREAFDILRLVVLEAQQQQQQE